MRLSRWRGSAPLVSLVAMSCVLLGLSLVPAAGVDQPVGDATATVETVPVTHSGDAADDPAVWKHPTDPAESLVIGNDKGGALDVYTMTGARIQQLTGGFYGNVDVRYGLPTAAGPRDVVAVYRAGLRLLTVDPATRQLSNITDSSTGSISSPIGGEGLCLYDSAVDGSTYAFLNNRSGVVAQFRLTDADGDGLIEGRVVRQWDVGAEVEGCVTDDELGHLYISEEDVALWKYGAEPTAATSTAARVAVERPVAAGGRFRPDIEGLTIVHQPGGTGYLVASSQAASNTLNSYLVYERQGTNAFVREFRVVAGAEADGCGTTDGIDALAADLGPGFPHGVFICQDNTNEAPASGNQNFKLVPLERVVGLSTGPPAPRPPVADIEVNCDLLACSFDGSGSNDPDGHVVDHVWAFGDDETATGPSPQHEYAAAGTYSVTLTVTDDSGLTATTARTVVVADRAPPVAFVGQAQSNTNSTTHQLVVPSAVVPGDGLLLFLGINTSATISSPTGVTGWQQLGTVTMSGAVTRVWRKVAQPGDAGTQVRVSLSGQSKGNFVVLAYRGTSTDDPVARATGLLDTPARAAHPTPVVAADPGSWVISYWTHKDSASTSLVPPSQLVVRASGRQSGSGTVKGLVGDSGGPVQTTSYGGLVATAQANASAASVWSIVLASP